MSKADKTRAFVIETCAPIFNKKGYAGTSLSDITEATGLTKGAIYGNFADKDEVAIAAYQYNVELLQKRLAEAVNGKDTAYERLIAFTEYYRLGWKGTFSRGGCPIQNASVEADDNLEFLKPYVRSSIRNWVAYIARIIEGGMGSGEFRPVDAEQFAYALITILEGGIMLSKIMGDQSLLFAALDRMVALIDNELKMGQQVFN